MLAATRQGRKLEWCSSAVTTTSSPGASPRPWATRLTPSVELRVKTISAGEAFRNEATSARAASNASVASSERTCTPRWTLAVWRLYMPTIASMTQRGLGAVEALSR